MRLRPDDFGYFFAFESFAGPWPLDGFVNELGDSKAEHQAILEEMSTRGLVEQVEHGRWQPTPAGQQAFYAAQETLRGQHVYDGAKSVSEAVAMLRNEAERLDAMERDGWRLVDTVEDDAGYLLHLEAGAGEVVLVPGGPRSRLSALASARSL
jgi:DNA-binding IclR family transcriptional regulator